MISSLLTALKKITVGVEYPMGEEDDINSDNTESEEEEGGVNIDIPKVQSGLTLGGREVAPGYQSADVQNEERKDKIERVEAIGNITALDPCMVNGVIDRLYQFDIAQFCNGGNGRFQRGSKVEFEAERSGKTPLWRVTKMKLYESEIEKTSKERLRLKTVVAQVKIVNSNWLEVELRKDGETFIKVPNGGKLDVGFQWMPGDWMQIHLENLGNEEDETFSDADLPMDIVRSRVISITPLQKKTIVGKVTRRHCFLIDDSIFYTKHKCKSVLPVGTTVRCIAIASKQQVRKGDFVSWRAILVEKSNFLKYASPDMIDPEADGLIDDVGKEIIDQHQELFWEKFGIKITPGCLKFPPLTIGNFAIKTLTITNMAGRTFCLQKIHFNQDPSVCQFEIKSSRQEPNGEVTFLPDDEVEFEVTCRPMMIGRTTEMCVFDFGQFLIARNFCVVGKSDEEQNLVVDQENERPNFRRRITSTEISKVVTDRDRRRIRGCQTIRAPFFSQKRLPLFQVPREMWPIVTKEDETELRRLYPTALEPLRFDNYKDKFAVNLWFEEMGNELRRRQYDLPNVVLKKHGSDSNIFYTFAALGIQDFQPPVNVQDAIDVFDAENPNTAKFHGTITKLYDQEVSCVFGDAFNEQYTGFPLTVQFSLGRTSYKRCHFAVQTAVDFLKEEVLFPAEEILVKPPRILVYEDDKTNEGDENVNEKVEKMLASRNPIDMSTATAVGKPKLIGQTIFNINPSSSSSNAELNGRRMKSAGSWFVSDTPSEPSCGTRKLEWFNSSLNEEQKDAVRRILRGQARPVPYIIYGPAGTGKTVTLVEAVMQVNKLDKNSRILVCAPSNAAADIIAEYLANSNQYHPGDFVRLNGFMRSGVSMMESIAPFCTDGEDLTNVAMHRLIVATCTTAGQFFSLDLYIGHFTHVFIDEAGYCTEPEALIPAVLLALSKGGQMILAGDPNQLGPVLMSEAAQSCGLEKSLLERLMCRKLYTRNISKFPKEKYNPLVLTKLVKNYRAHETLLKLPSQLFYDDELISKASHEESYSLLQDQKLKKILVSEGVPLIFHGVQGLSARERDSPSWYNKEEAVQVVHYVTSLVRNCGLKYEDIGIITPYRKQVEKIRFALRNTLRDDNLPKVASVEEFQGGERKVIIISTVRSVNVDKIDKYVERLTFLYHSKRFNVAITRAKALMIVVGNPHLLAVNKHWSQLLRYAIELNAYKGCNLPIHLDQGIRRFFTQENPTPSKDSNENHDDTTVSYAKDNPNNTTTSTQVYNEEEYSEPYGF